MDDYEYLVRAHKITTRVHRKFIKEIERQHIKDCDIQMHFDTFRWIFKFTHNNKTLYINLPYIADISQNEVRKCVKKLKQRTEGM